jgi:hypothetical protein
VSAYRPTNAIVSAAAVAAGREIGIAIDAE